MSLRNRTVKVKRTAAGDYVAGAWVPGAESEFDVVCSVQPLRPNEMKLLPEGRQESEALRIYSDVELKPADERSKVQADLVDITGAGTAYEYEVLSDAPWQNSIIPHHKAIIVKIAKGE